MVAASTKKASKSPAKRGAGKPSPVITKAKTPSSPLASPTPSQRSRGRASVKPNARSKDAQSPISKRSRDPPTSPTSPRGTPRRGAAVKACLNMEAAAAHEAAFEDKPSGRRSKNNDDDFDAKMEVDHDAFDEPSFGKKPPRPRSKPGTPRYVWVNRLACCASNHFIFASKQVPESDTRLELRSSLRDDDGHRRRGSSTTTIVAILKAPVSEFASCRQAKKSYFRDFIFFHHRSMTHAHLFPLPLTTLTGSPLVPNAPR